MNNPEPRAAFTGHTLPPRSGAPTALAPENHLPAFDTFAFVTGAALLVDAGYFFP